VINSGTTAPVQASGVSGAVKVAAGFGHTLAMTNSGAIWGWGNDTYGALGDGKALNCPTPEEIAWPNNIVDLSAGAGGFSDGGGQTLVARFTSTESFWSSGNNSNGQVGDGSEFNRYAPTLVNLPYVDSNNDGLPDWKAVDLGYNPLTPDTGAGIISEAEAAALGINWTTLSQANQFLLAGMNPFIPPPTPPAPNPGDHTGPAITITYPLGN
jgi:hypothetical protein